MIYIQHQIDQGKKWKGTLLIIINLIKKYLAEERIHKRRSITTLAESSTENESQVQTPTNFHQCINIKTSNLNQELKKSNPAVYELW